MISLFNIENASTGPIVILNTDNYTVEKMSVL